MKTLFFSIETYRTSQAFGPGESAYQFKAEAKKAALKNLNDSTVTKLALSACLFDKSTRTRYYTDPVEVTSASQANDFFKSV